MHPRVLWVWAAPLGVVMLAGTACGHPEVPPPSTVFKATLRVDNEVPDTASDRNAAGNATVTIAGDTIKYTLNITTAPRSAITRAHIHQGAAGAIGLIRVNLCGEPGSPACPSGTGTVTGATRTVLGISFDSLLVLMRGFGTYVNVHTVQQPVGLMRGQLLPQP